MKNRVVLILAAFTLAFVATTALADPPVPNPNAEKNIQQTGCNANNPDGGGCPQGAGGYGRNDGMGAVCGNGEHTGNPHCVTPEPQATATSVPPTATSVPPTATSVPPTATSVPPTATSVPPTATAIVVTLPTNGSTTTESGGPSTTPTVVAIIDVVPVAAVPVEVAASPIFTLGQPGSLPKTGTPFPVLSGFAVGLLFTVVGWALRRMG